MYDFIIIGGGILGISTAMQLIEAYPDKRIVVLEKENSLARHQTGHNSGVIHAGVYYTPGSLKARFCQQGNLATKAFCKNNDIPFEVCGKLLVATNETEEERMRALWRRMKQNGLERTWLSAAELREKEPNITGKAAIKVPSSGIVDYSMITAKMAEQFTLRGGEIFFDTQVLALQERRHEVIVSSSQGDFMCRHLITCGGLMADRLIRMLGQDPGFQICPFRGEYYVLPQQHQGVVNHLIYPIPDPSMPFLGVHLTRMIGGSITVGPNAVLALKREGYRKRDLSLRDILQIFTHSGTLKVLIANLRPGLIEMKNSILRRGYLEAVRKYCPQLTLDDLKPYPAGVRAQAISNEGKLVDDFLFVTTRRTLNVGNAPSPAATSAIPIGAHIVTRLQKQLST